MKEKRTGQELIYSYLDLRKAVGLIGMLLPLVLAGGVIINTGRLRIEPSISYYYHTVMRDVFVGSVCAIGLFLFFYRGYEAVDNAVANIAGFSAVGLAWFPTEGAVAAPVRSTLHIVFAAVFFLSLASFSLFLFTKTDKPQSKTDEKRKRNAIYLLCGVTMLVCLILIVVGIATGLNEDTPLVFAAETAALVAFGVSWLVKGEAVLKDHP